MSVLKIGWSEKSITPDKKISLAGQFAERISEYEEKPLTATVTKIHIFPVYCTVTAWADGITVSSGKQ